MNSGAMVMTACRLVLAFSCLTWANTRRLDTDDCDVRTWFESVGPHIVVLPVAFRRLSFKPDASFFRKIAIGAVGARAVAKDLSGHCHDIVELERGSTDTKLWKDVKRKRVRIPDLVCRRCGLRIESRAKTKPVLSMSHSRVDEARAWDFGMVNSDVVAFPVCAASEESYWSLGRLDTLESYWRERNWVRWRVKGAINYFRVGSFRRTLPSSSSTKGVTEGSETSIAWRATFSTRSGIVEATSPDTVSIRRDSDGHRYTWRIRKGQKIKVTAGQAVRESQAIASCVDVMSVADFRCSGTLKERSLIDLLRSRERTQRFTGVKLARLRREKGHYEVVSELTRDPEEDVYIRLEGASYLASVCDHSVETLFQPFLDCPDEQNQLEAVIALGETGTNEAIALLSKILDDTTYPYFLRSTVAWSLAQNTTADSTERLVRAFGDVQKGIREEALEGLISLGRPAIPALLRGLENDNRNLAAGCAEALRQMQSLAPELVDELTQRLDSTNSLWTVWLLGHLPREQVASAIMHLQESAPHLQYAMSVLWAFVESWVAKGWEVHRRPRRTVSETE